MWPAKLKVVTIYPFRERASFALRRIGRMQDSHREVDTQREKPWLNGGRGGEKRKWRSDNYSSVYWTHTIG